MTCIGNVLFKEKGENKFKDITNNAELIHSIQKDKNLDYLVFEGLRSEDYLDVLMSIYVENVAVIAFFVGENDIGFKSFLETLPEQRIKDTYSHLTKNYFLTKTLPILAEGIDGLSSIKEIVNGIEGDFVLNNIFDKTEEEWCWSGIYPSYFLMRNVDLEELEKRKYFKGDKELHSKLLNSMNEKIQHFAKPYFIPVVKVDTILGKRSYYGGKPLSVENVTCKCCKEDMYLLVQLDFLECPVFIRQIFGRDEGVLQIYSCKDLETFQFRLLDSVPNTYCDVEELMDIKEIQTWVKKFEKPSPKDIRENNVNFSKEERSFMKWYYDKEDKVVEDKVGGIPTFNQAKPRMKCPISKEPMKFIMQLESYVNLENFNGRVYLFQSPVDKSVLKVYWDCD